MCLCGDVLSHTSASNKLGLYQRSQATPIVTWLILLGYSVDVASASLGHDNMRMLMKVEDHTPQLSNKIEC